MYFLNTYWNLCIICFKALQRLLGADVPPNKVLEIKSESLGMQQVLARDEAMVMYAPPFNSNDKKCYEIILQRPHTDSNTTSFSLYRSPSQQETEDKFNVFLHRLPLFVSIVKEVSKTNNYVFDVFHYIIYLHISVL